MIQSWPEPPDTVFLWYENGQAAAVLPFPARTFSAETRYPPFIDLVFGMTVPEYIRFHQDRRQANRYRSTQNSPFNGVKI